MRTRSMNHPDGHSAGIDRIPDAPFTAKASVGGPDLLLGLLGRPSRRASVFLVRVITTGEASCAALLRRTRKPAYARRHT